MYSILQACDKIFIVLQVYSICTSNYNKDATYTLYTLMINQGYRHFYG